MISEVKYYRINAVNTGIATSNSGEGNPTEEITAPIAAGTYSSGTGTTTITNQTVGGFGTLSVGQYLYYINPSGNYVLMGQIASIASPATTVTLTSNSIEAVAPTAGAALAGAYSLITTTENIYIRVKTDKTSQSPNLVIPEFSKWRTSGNITTGVNNPNITTLEQISNVGTPVSNAATITPIQFTIQTVNNFTFTTGSTPRAWPNTTDFPSYIWLRVAIVNNGVPAPLASKTLYRWTTQESFDGVTAQANQLTVAQLQALGYNVTGGTSANDGNVGGN